MKALLYDGLTARPWSGRVRLDGDRVVAVSEAVDAAGAPCAHLDWPLAKIREQSRDETSYRLSHDGSDARLVVDIQIWQALTGRSRRDVVRRRRGGEWRVIGGLATAGLSVMVLVFGIVPLAAEPLARWTPPSLEARFGRSMQAQVNLVMPDCDGDPAGAEALRRLGETLSKGADTRFPIQVRAVRAPFVNAFALPGGTVMVTDELIDQARSPDELAGVLAHEIAHVERRHVMQAAWRSMGAGLVLDAVVGGGSGAGQQAILLASGLSNQRFSRKLETEADVRGIQLLARHDISSQGMADFFVRLSDRKADARVRQAAEWFSSHPDSVARAALARASAHRGRPALSDADWKSVKGACKAGGKAR